MRTGFTGIPTNGALSQDELNKPQLTINQKYQLRQFGWITLAGIICGFIYPLMEDGWQLFPLVNGTIAGFIIGASVALLELFVFGGKLQRVAFINVFLLRVTVYFLLAGLVTFNLFVISRTIKYNLTPVEAFYSQEFQTYLSTKYHIALAFCFLAISLAVFTLQMARKLGPDNLWAFVTGKYQTPKKEMCIFMFISLGGIDAIINKTGNLQFHNFINDFVYDVSNIIRVRKGKIVHYMEDEVVVFWKVRAGVDKANCIRTYFELCHKIAGHFEYYHSKYGLLPKPKCAVHAGSAVRAEIGEVKSEISFFGDVVNTTSRILHEAVTDQTDILISQSVMDLIQLPIHYQVSDQGDFSLKGKHRKIHLYSLQLQGDE